MTRYKKTIKANIDKSPKQFLKESRRINSIHLCKQHVQSHTASAHHATHATEHSASTPKKIPPKDAPEATIMGIFNSVAMALANIVLPVPGGPTIMAPFSRLPPALTKSFPSLKRFNSLFISSTAAF